MEDHFQQEHMVDDDQHAVENDDVVMMDCGEHDDCEEEDVKVSYRSSMSGLDPSAPLPPPSDETSPRSALDFPGGGGGGGGGGGLPKKKSPKASSPPPSLASLPVNFQIPSTAADPCCSSRAATVMIQKPFSPTRRPIKSSIRSLSAARGSNNDHSVQFADMVHFRQIPHIADLSPEEIKDVWMMPEDYQRIRATVKSTVSVMIKREKRQLQEHQLQRRRRRQQQQQHDSHRRQSLRRHLSAPPIPTIREENVVATNNNNNDDDNVDDCSTRSERSSTSNASLHSSSTNDDDDDDDDITWAHLTFVYEFPGDHAIDPDFCTRGLETRTKVGTKRRSFHKLRTRSAVLNEQELQLDEVSDDDDDSQTVCLDPHYIAMASMEHSLACRQSARARGIMDARAIQDYVADVRRDYDTTTATIVAECLAEMA